MLFRLRRVAMAKNAKKKCNKRGCKKDAISPRAKFCTGCFKKHASYASMQRKVFHGGGGVPGNRGNFVTGKTKKLAGKRSGIRRSTKKILVVRNPWLDLILSGTKTWEVRDVQTKKRGKIHLALSGAGGRIVGQCCITDSFAINKSKLGRSFRKHRIKNLALITYQRPHVWVLAKPHRYQTSFACSHPHGAVKWVNL